MIFINYWSTLRRNANEIGPTRRAQLETWWYIPCMLILLCIIDAIFLIFFLKIVTYQRHNGSIESTTDPLEFIIGHPDFLSGAKSLLSSHGTYFSSPWVFHHDNEVVIQQINIKFIMRSVLMSLISLICLSASTFSAA